MKLISTSTDNIELQERLRWYVNIRWIFLLALSIFGISTQYLDIGFTQQVVDNLLISLGALFLNGVFHIALQRDNLSRRILVGIGVTLITFDIISTTALVFIQGGLESRTVIVYAIPILMSGALFGRAATYTSATVSALLYTILVSLDYSGVVQVQNISNPALHDDFYYLIRTASFYAVTIFIIGLIADFVTQILKKRETIEQMNELKSNFVSLASHQLKTPIAEIREFANNLDQGIVGNLTEEQAEYVSHIKRISGNTLAMINELLDLSKLEASKGRLVFDEVSMEEAVKDAIKTYETRLRGSVDVNIQTNHENRDRTVVADRDRLIEIICILLANAVKFSDGQGDIQIMTYVRDDFGVIEVADQGTGINQETLKTIFKKESVMEGKPSAEKGSGIGLYLAKQLMLAQDGDITVDSTPGEGSSFKLLLPLK